MPVTKFPRLTIWLFCKKRPFWIFGHSSGGFSKKPTAIIRDFALRKKGRGKTQMAKVVKCFHLVTWAQKIVTKKRN